MSSFSKIVGETCVGTVQTSEQFAHDASSKSYTLPIVD